jgi:hypothetical protein
MVKLQLAIDALHPCAASASTRSKHGALQLLGASMAFEMFLISLSLVAILFFRYMKVCRVQKCIELLHGIALAFCMGRVASQRRNALCKNASDKSKKCY